MSWGYAGGDYCLQDVGPTGRKRHLLMILIFGHMIKSTLETANLPPSRNQAFVWGFINPLVSFEIALVMILSPYESEGYGGWEGEVGGQDVEWANAAGWKSSEMPHLESSILVGKYYSDQKWGYRKSSKIKFRNHIAIHTQMQVVDFRRHLCWWPA